MMSKTKFLVILGLLMSIFVLINSSYAYDIEDNESLTDGINKALNNTDTGVLDLKEGHIYEAENIQIGSNKNVTIKGSGSGSVIDGLDFNRLFYLNSGSSLYLYNLNLTGGKITNGNGSFINNNGGYLYLENCTISNGILPITTGRGGIYTTTGSTTIIEKCVFENNSGYTGSSICNYGNLTVTNSVFKNNTAYYGSVLNGGIMHINDSDFIENKFVGPTSMGTDIYITGSSSIINNALFYKTNTEYGSIFITNVAGNVTITSSKFTNGSSITGGGVYIRGGNVTIENTLFDSNRVSTAYRGGAINIQGANSVGNLWINNCNFTNNEGFDGGAVNGDPNAQFSIYINNCIFNGNYGRNTGGAVYIGRNLNFNINNSIFKNNLAKSGGAVYIYGGITNITQCNFIDNMATTSQGGAIYQWEGTLNIKYSVFMNNTDVNGANHLQEAGRGANLNVDFNWWGANNLTIEAL
jgi:hypothetical protein